MTDEKLILDYLNNNYSVTIGHNSYSVTDKESGVTYDHSKSGHSNFNKVFLLIFGDFKIDDDTSSVDLMNRWYDIGCRKVGKKLNEYFNSYDGTLGSKNIFDELTNKFGTTMNESFLMNEFRKDYKSRWLEPSLNNYLENIDMSLGSIISLEHIMSYYKGDLILFNDYILELFNNHYHRHLSIIIHDYLINFNKDAPLQEFLDNFNGRLAIETDENKESALSDIKDWYRINILDDKLIPLFREFVITLNSKEWVVTWVGHGRLTEEKLLSQFMDEQRYNKEYILQRYEDWFAEEVIDASERYLKKAW